MKVGDKVRLRKDSQYYSQAPNLVGTIMQVSVEIGWCQVKFENGYENGYRHEGRMIDLELVPKTNFNAEAIKAIKMVISQK